MTTPNQRWRAKNPEKVRAHWQVQDAVGHGVLTPQPCEQCGNVKAHAHHDDYAAPLVVRWLCALCHRRIHPRPPTARGPRMTIRRRRRAAQQALAREIQAAGFSYRAIASAVGVSVGTVYKWLNVTSYD